MLSRISRIERSFKQRAKQKLLKYFLGMTKVMILACDNILREAAKKNLDFFLKLFIYFVPNLKYNTF